jgi:demethylmenaquinone methyltransferase/2-methoxy-6-polyprenyl-1,4-benzoquinol methylase
MFAEIAPRYDFLNGVLSLGGHHRWRRRAADLAGIGPGGWALDVCTGTGDLAQELAGRTGPSGRVLGVDFCEEMVRLGIAKGRPSASGAGAPRLVVSDAHAMPVPDGVFDCATVAFGLRNARDPRAVLAEMSRAVKPGGRIVCLEFGLPTSGVRRILVRLYERAVVPMLGAVLSRRSAYEYLARSIAAFSSPGEVRGLMRSVGLVEVSSVAMSLGSVYAHCGTRP